MLNHYLQFGNNPKVDYVIKLVISLGLLLGLCPLIIEMKGQMPVTLQSLIVLFVSIAFGWRIGVPAVLLYLIAGGIGLPVFAGYRSGVESFFGLTGGFFFGFVAASAVCGYLTELQAFRKTIPAILNWFLGHTIIILLGALWMMRLNPEGWQKIVTDILPGAIVKSIIGALIIQIIIKLMTRQKKRAFED